MSDSPRIRLWNVRVETDVVVLASTEISAVMTAEGAVKGLDFDGDFDGYPSHVTNLRQLPHGWDRRCLPYVDDDLDMDDFGYDGEERTVAAWLEWIATQPMTDAEREEYGQLTLEGTVGP